MEIISRKQAKLQEIKKYFTGIPCNRGHLSERYTVTGNCILCKRQVNDQKYFSNNKELVLQKERDRYWNNKEKYDHQHRKYYSQNKEFIGQQVKKWRINNPHKSIEYALGNRKRAKQWRVNNPWKVTMYSAKRKAQKLKATPVWADLKAIEQVYINCILINKDHKNCNIQETYVVDHIIPLQGKTVCGLHVGNNLRIISWLENNKKRNKLIEEVII